jgi:hypothetical protein
MLRASIIWLDENLCSSSMAIFDATTTCKGEVVRQEIRNSKSYHSHHNILG